MSGAAMSKELAAMVQIEQAFSGLDEAERDRVLVWAGSRFSGGRIHVPHNLGTANEKASSAPHASSDAQSATSLGSKLDAIESLAEFYDQASPATDADKALVVGYWLQMKAGASELESQKINFELKHLGHGIGNVTRAL